MNKLLLLALCLGLLTACRSVDRQTVHLATSPDGQVQVQVFADAAGRPGYRATFGGQTVVDSSLLGFVLRDAEPMQAGFAITGSRTSNFDETWEMPWGEYDSVRNHGSYLVVDFAEQAGAGRRFSLHVKVFDDGFGFRYEVPAQAALGDSVYVMDELTEFVLTGDHMAWWAPGDWDIYEHVYGTDRLSAIDAGARRNHPNLNATYIPDARAVNTPLTMKADAGYYLSIHEAALYDYPDMTLHIDEGSPTLRAALVAWPDGVKFRGKAPFVTPWRAVILGREAGDLIESTLVLNLNDPNKLGKPDWIAPMKYVGIWWEMHLGVSTWDYAGSQDMTAFVDPSALRPSGRHGATTENTRRYIDFAAANGFGGVLVEGWNTGWELWIGPNRPQKPFDFVTPYPDYDLEGLAAYAREKGVQLIGHHETSACVDSYEEQMDTAFKLFQRVGIHAVKTGYVGPIQPKGQYHHGQYMVRHYQRVVEQAAQYQIAIDAHEPIKATGIRRTWPNFMAREGLRGQEFNAWATDGGNPPEHLTIVPFTRMLGGPIDFTPGIFKIDLKPFKPENQINTTLAQQLALYVVIYGPLQMAADLPQHYEGQPAFQFIRDVAVDWQDSRVLNGEVGDYVTMARKERGGERWFVGSLSDESPRSFELALDFLDAGATYTATIYADAPDAHFKTNPTAIEISTQEVTAETVLSVRLAAGGGLAISLVKK
ncbi:MAG: glycoside hydrolase family 97 protein [Bacteroidia bacterium]